MSIRPVTAYGRLTAEPLLPDVLARIARTPTARLSLVFRLLPRLPCDRIRFIPANKLECLPPPPGEVPPNQEVRLQRLRPLGELIDLYRILTGSIIDTPLRILECDPPEPPNPAADVGVLVDFCV